MVPFLKAGRSIFRPWLHDRSCTNLAYSTGKYKALLIAINYENPDDQVADAQHGEGSNSEDSWHKLHGCHNDASRMEGLLRETYSCSDITFMSDEASKRGTKLYPTKDNIMRELNNLIAGAQPGDVFVLFYAGHSGQIKALRDKREKDGQDEYIVAVDGHCILDDHLRVILVDPLPAGCRLTAIFDSCHSGTLLDLDHYPDPNDRHSEPNTMTHAPDVQVSKPRRSLPEELLRSLLRSSANASHHIWSVAQFYARLRIARRTRQSSSSGSGPLPFAPSGATIPEEVIVAEVSQDDITVIAEPVSNRENKVAGNKTVSGVHASIPIRCKACRLRAKNKIVVSIASCLDSEEAVELVKKKEALMTPVLCKLLAEEPEISAEELAIKLQDQMFYNILETWVNRRKQVRRAAAEERQKRFDRFVSLLTAFRSWQHVQIGSEHPNSMKEPFLVLSKRSDRK